MSGSEAGGAGRGREFFRELLSNHEGSGLTLKALAESKGIKPATVYAWARRLRATERCSEPASRGAASIGAREPEPLVPVRVVAEHARRSPGEASRVELVIRGDVEVRVPESFDEQVLVRLVEALRRGC